MAKVRAIEVILSISMAPPIPFVMVSVISFNLSGPITVITLDTIEKRIAIRKNRWKPFK